MKKTSDNIWKYFEDYHNEYMTNQNDDDSTDDGNSHNNSFDYDNVTDDDVIVDNSNKVDDVNDNSDKVDDGGSNVDNVDDNGNNTLESINFNNPEDIFRIKATKEDRKTLEEIYVKYFMDKLQTYNISNN